MGQGAKFWGTSVGMFALGYVWIFLLTWLPTHLVGHRGNSTDETAVFGCLFREQGGAIEIRRGATRLHKWLK